MHEWSEMSIRSQKWITGQNYELGRLIIAYGKNYF